MGEFLLSENYLGMQAGKGLSVQKRHWLKKSSLEHAIFYSMINDWSYYFSLGFFENIKFYRDDFCF